MTILIDASVFCAYANTKDIHHEKAKRILEEVMVKKKETVITTEYIFDETVTVALRKTGKEKAKELGNHILNAGYKIAKIDQKSFEKSWQLFQEENNFSFTDCSCIIIMEEIGITKIATFDKEFKKIKGIEIIDQ